MPYILQTDRLTKIIGEKELVRDVDLHVRKGEIYGFLGPNGAGKTTVMKLVTNLWKPTGGRVLLFGEPLTPTSYGVLKRMREEYEMTVMVSSHILGEMEAMADTVGIIHRGRMREEISLRELEGRGTSYLHLTVDDPGRASVLLSDVMHLGSFRVMKGGIIRIYDRQASPQEVAGVLARHHVAVEEIGRRSETLEEHFLKLTSEEGSTWES